MSDKLDRVIGDDSLRKYFDSPYMGVYSISAGKKPIVTIAEILYGKITLDGGRKENHIVLRFSERSVDGMEEVKPLVLNATNQKMLEKLYGKGANALIGKKIQFYIEPEVRAIGGGFTEGIRICPKAPRDVSPAPAPVPVCSDCGSDIKAFGEHPAEYIASRNEKRYGRKLCIECAKSVADNPAPVAPIAEEVDFLD